MTKTQPMRAIARPVRKPEPKGLAAARRDDGDLDDSEAEDEAKETGSGSGFKKSRRKTVVEDIRNEIEKMPLARSIAVMQAIPEVREWLDEANAIPVDFDQIREEVRKYTVTSFNLKLGQAENFGVDPQLQNPLKDLRDIAGVTLRIQGHRDRVVSIYGRLHAKHHRLTRLKHRARHFLRIKYAMGVKGEKTPLMDRIDMALYDIVLKLEEVTAAMEQVNLISMNLTNSHFTYRQIDETAKSLREQMEYRGGRDYR